MSGLQLLRVFDSVYLLALAVWLGSLLFVLFGLTPRRPSDSDGTARGLWGRLVAWHLVCGALALPALVCGALAVPELRGWRVGAQAAALLCAMGITLFAGGALSRAPREGRTAPDSGARSLLSFLAVILVCLVVARVYRATLRTTGIIEPDPVTRARDAEAHQRADLRNKAANDAMWNEIYRQQRGQSTTAPDPGAASGASPKNAAANEP